MEKATVRRVRKSTNGLGFDENEITDAINDSVDKGFVPPPMGTTFKKAGKVIDAQTGKPIFNATVSFGTVGTTTDEQGDFELVNHVPIGEVFISHASYTPETVSDTTEVQLLPKMEMLPDVEVTAEPTERVEKPTLVPPKKPSWTFPLWAKIGLGVGVILATSAFVGKGKKEKTATIRI